MDWQRALALTCYLRSRDRCIHLWLMTGKKTISQTDRGKLHPSMNFETEHPSRNRGRQPVHNWMAASTLSARRPFHSWNLRLLARDAQWIGDKMITHVEKPILVTELRKLSENNKFQKQEILIVDAVMTEIEQNKDISGFSEDLSLALSDIVERHIK